MEQRYAPPTGRFLARAALCALTALALLASLCLPPASALAGFVGSAWADGTDEGSGSGGADGDEDEGGGDDGGDADVVDGAKVTSAKRAASVTASLPGAKVTKVGKRYLYTHGSFTVVIGESAGAFAAGKVPSAACTGGKTSSFKCANYVKVTFGIAVRKAARDEKNKKQAYALADGKKVCTGADGKAALSNYLNDDGKALIWIESQECVGDRAGDADAPKIEFKNGAKPYTVYGDYGSKGYKDVVAIESDIVMNKKADDESLSVANKIPLVYKNKPADQVFWQRGKDGGNTEADDRGHDNNKKGKLYSEHRYSFYVDNGDGAGSYEDYTGYNFIHGKTGATSCEQRDCELNVTINLGSCGVIASTHWNNAGTASNPKRPETNALDHYDRIVNPWACIKMKQPEEKVRVDLAGGSLSSLGAEDGWYKKASCTGAKQADWKKNFPDKDVTVYGTAAKPETANTIRYYVDGKLVQSCTVDFSDLGLNDTYSSSYAGPLDGRVSISDANLVERSSGVAKWDVASVL